MATETAAMGADTTRDAAANDSARQPEKHILEARDLSCGYKGTAVLKHVNLSVTTGDVVCLLGPNGVGKTTLFKTLLGFLPPIAGGVVVDGKPRDEYNRRQFSAKVAYVPQNHEPPFPYEVIDVVLTGCAGRLGVFDSPSRRDRERADEVLDELGISYLRNRSYTEISGGEQQMTLIARSLMQNSSILMMDEPTAALDFGNQVAVLDCVRRLAETGHGVIMTTHNPDHAFLCGTGAVLITPGGDILTGSVDDIVTEENLARAYGITVHLTSAVEDEGNPIKTCVPQLGDNAPRRQRP